MQTILFFGILISLLLIFIQDWKYRHIHIVLPFLLFCFSFCSIDLNSILKLKIAGINLLFFGLVFLFMVVYMSIKNKTFQNPFLNYFGLGDVFFYIAIAPIFETRNYILFFISSMIFALFLKRILSQKINNNSIPLAGFSALFLGICLLFESFFNFSKISLL